MDVARSGGGSRLVEAAADDAADAYQPTATTAYCGLVSEMSED
jgi:hypothetical protein